MAVVPLSGTNIRLLSGIPFNNDYKHSRWFTSKATQTSYFTSKPVVHSINQANFQRIEGKHFIAVDRSIDELWSTNYIMFQNAQYNSKWFYAFVTKLEYKQRNNTYVHFEIDVLQTWKFDMNFKPSFVVREHRPLWNADGSPVINTIDEGLDYGTTYETVDLQTYKPQSPFFFLVIAMKEKRHWNEGSQDNKITPTLNGLPQPLTYYVHPFTATGLVPEIQVDGKRLVHSAEILDVLEGIFTSEDAVNNVVSTYVTDYIGLDIPYDSNSNIMNFPATNFERADFSDNANLNFSTVHLKKAVNYSRLTKDFGNKYDGYHNVTESKLLMYPYTQLIIEDFRGNRLAVKNEYIEDSNIKLSVMGSMGTTNKVTYGILNYLTSQLTDTGKNTMTLEQALINSDPNDLPIINDYLSAYLQGNRNSINTQRNQAYFNAISSMVSSTVGGVGSATAKSPSGIGVASSGVGVVKGAGQGVLDLQAIQSKIKDADNMPPQMTKMGSNTMFDYGNQYTGVYVIKKQIHKEYRKILTDFFNMFGYKANEVKVPNFMTRQNWNYVQTLNCVITGNFNNEDLQELKNVFDNGITLWHTDDIGNYSLANEVR